MQICGSCSPGIPRGFTKHSNPGYHFTSVFAKDFEKALYQVDISTGKKNLSGLAMIKKMKESNSYRTIFIAETGLKYFDFEFFHDDSVEVHYVMVPMNRKGLIRTLTNDLGLLLRTEVNDKELACYLPEKPKGAFVAKEKHNGNNYYYFDDRTNGPDEIYRKACLSLPTKIDVGYNPDHIPSSIIFTHGYINFKMELKLITE
jgi:hypothetical protein